MAGLILVLFGLIPKMSILVASIPQFVLGGAGIVMFGILLSSVAAVLLNLYFNGYHLEE